MLSFLKKKSFFNEKSRGFTLAEVLMVIAIIGLLSSIVLVATRGARERAEIAAMLQFSSNLHHSIGAYLVGEWRFSEGSEDDLADSSGYGNDGTWNGAGAHWADSGVSQLGMAGQFSTGGVASYIEVLDDESLDVTNALTIQVWFKPYVIPSEAVFLVSKEQSYDVRLEGSPAEIQFYVWPDSVGWGLVGVVYSFKSDKWYHVACTYYSGSPIEHPVFKIFLNGTLIIEEVKDEVFGPKDIQNTSNPLHFGRSTLGFAGLMDDIRIYEEELSSAQIKKLYVEGAGKRGLLTKE